MYFCWNGGWGTLPSSLHPYWGETDCAEDRHKGAYRWQRGWCDRCGRKKERHVKRWVWSVLNPSPQDLPLVNNLLTFDNVVPIEVRCGQARMVFEDPNPVPNLEFSFNKSRIDRDDLAMLL